MTIFVCEDSFEAVFSAIYDVWASKISHEELRIDVGPIGQMEFFASYRELLPDTKKAARVMEAIYKKISWKAYRQCLYCASSNRKDRADLIYRFLLLGFTVGREITNYLKEPYVMNLFECSRAVGNEMHFHREFLRFTKMDQSIYLSKITPAHDVLQFVGEHFEDRMASENFLIYDANRKKALIHEADRHYYFRNLTKEECNFLNESYHRKDDISDMWVSFFETIAIKERKNPTCQRNHLPIHYRKNMTEFMNQ